MKLIDQVKPEVLKAIRKETKINYEASYRSIIASLKSHGDYRELSIKEIDTLLMFLPDKLHPDGRTDFYFGDYLLKNKYKI